MAILPDAANALQITLKGLNQGNVWQNRFHLQAAGSMGATSANLDTLCTAVATAWTTNIAPLCNPLVSLTEVDAIELTTRSSPAFYSTLVTPSAGTRTGTPLPLSAACVISWTVPNRYRGGHGRIYVPAGNVADVITGKQWNTAGGGFLATARTAATAFHNALQGLTIGAVGLDLVVMSYFFGSHKTDAIPHPPPVMRPSPIPYAVTGARVRTRLDTQRRRLGKELA